MTSRPGIVATVRQPADGGQSPNRYVPEITAELRVFWPPRATPAEIRQAIDAAVDESYRKIGEILAKEARP